MVLKVKTFFLSQIGPCTKSLLFLISDIVGTVDIFDIVHIVDIVDIVDIVHC